MVDTPTSPIKGRLADTDLNELSCHDGSWDEPMLSAVHGKVILQWHPRRDQDLLVWLIRWDCSNPSSRSLPFGSQMSHKENDEVRMDQPQQDFSPRSNSMCHQGGLYSLAVTTMPEMASVHLMSSSLLQQDPMIPWEAWFTILLPCF